MNITRSIRAPLFMLALLAISAAAFAQFSISVSFAPPELPVYEQPLLPGEGYIWTPGYWAYAGDDDNVIDLSELRLDAQNAGEGAIITAWIK